MELSLENVTEIVNQVATSGKNIHTGFEALKALVDRDKISKSEVDGLVSQLQREFVTAQQGQIALGSLVMEMRDALRKAKATENELARYELHQTEVGSLVYRLKADQANGEPVHYICANCRSELRKAILQPAHEGKTCTVCKTYYKFIDEPPEPTTYGGGRMGW